MKVNVKCEYCKCEDLKVIKNEEHIVTGFICNGCNRDLNLDDIIITDNNFRNYEEDDTEILYDEFSSILENNTREEFNERYSINTEDLDTCLYKKDTKEIVLGCPYDSSCKVDVDCSECWIKTIKESRFKDELN